MRLVLFDLDGTLVDSQAIIYASAVQAFGACGLEPPTRRRMLGVVGLSLATALEQAAEPGIDDAQLARVVAAYKEAFAGFRETGEHAEVLFPGAAEAVATLARREDVVLGVATGKSRRGALHIVEHFGWERAMVTVQTADDAPSKPHPAMVEQAARETGVAPADVVMIGDTTFDITMARAAGAQAIGVSWGNHDVPALRSAGAAHVIDSFEELVPTLDNMAREQGR